jgi:bifunctional non-homologous end joining protein LigD
VGVARGRGVRIEDFVVVGWTEPKRARGGFGALHIAQYGADDLVYLGSVGSGFRDSELKDILEMIEEREVDECACTAGPIPSGKQHHWARPEIVAEVKYKEMTDHGLARQPSFSRLRPDKAAAECSIEGAAHVEAVEPEPITIVEEKTVPFTNLDKIFWPDEPYTKGDLIDYHREISEWMLPYLEDRPLVMTRYPDGIGGEIVLPEGRTSIRAGLAQDRLGLERWLGARDLVLHC